MAFMKRPAKAVAVQGQNLIRLMGQVDILLAGLATGKELSSVHIADTELAVLVMGQGIFNMPVKNTEERFEKKIRKRCFLFNKMVWYC